MMPNQDPTSTNAEKSTVCVDGLDKVQKNLHMETHSFLSVLSRVLRITAVLIPVLLLSHCATNQPETGNMLPAPGAAAGTSYRAAPPGAMADESAVAKSRPGLGTQLGHEIYDSSSTATFYRKPSGQPDAVGTFHYNDEEGARLMAGLQGRTVRRGGDFELIPGKLRVSVMGDSWASGKAREYYEAGKGIFVIGTPGEGYSLKLENRTDKRMEVVVSVDGLNLLDGQPASVKKVGYVIAAKSTVILRGMRVGGKLFSLEFGSVSESRASKAFGQKGARNVGVVGVACYEEDEITRRRAQVEEIYVRDGARAFGS